MRTLKSILVLGLALSTFTAAEAAKLTFKVTNPNEKVKVILTFSQSGEQKEVAIDAAGNGNIEITGFTPQYVTMQYTRGRRTLYLDPNQDLTLSFDSDNMWRNSNVNISVILIIGTPMPRLIMIHTSHNDTRSRSKPFPFIT